MSLVQECLEAFNSFGTNIGNLNIDALTYTEESGAVLINMESAAAIHEIYELDLSMESDLVRAIAASKGSAIPVEESIGSVIDSIGTKFKSLWEKAKKLFADLRDKILGWLTSAKDKMKAFFAKVKAIFSKADPNALTITVNGETITVTRSDVEKAYADRDKARATLDRKMGELDAAQKSNRRKDIDHNRLQTKFTFRMYKYTNLTEFKSILSGLYNEAMSGTGVNATAGSIVKQIEDLIASTNGLSKKTPVRAINIDTKLTRTEEEINKGILDMLGIKNVNSDIEISKIAWKYFRDNAEPGQEKPTISQDDASIPRMNAIRVENEKLLAGIDPIKTVIKTMFDNAIKKLNEWEKKVANISNTSLYTDLSKHISAFTTTVSRMQSVVNIFIGAFVGAVKERQTAVVSFVKGCYPAEALSTN